MKTVKIISALTSSIIFILIALALNLEDPLKANYRNTINKMMEAENMNSENEVLAKYPALREAKKNITKADNLKTQICTKTSGGAPALTKAEKFKLKKLKQEWLFSRQNVERLLKKMKSKEVLAATP